MGINLTHKDRNNILKSLVDIKLESIDTDDYLMQGVSVYLKDNPPLTGSEVNFHQFSTDLINFIRLNPEDEKSEYVRRALKFFLQIESTNSGLNNSVVKSFVASFTLHEISEKQNLRIVDETHGLSPDERKEAKRLLFDLAKGLQNDDESLLKFSQDLISNLGNNETTCLVKRFQRNVGKLNEFLSSDKKLSAEDKMWARGALQYIRLNEDIIPDELGIIGLLDDMYVAATAVRLIDPIVQPIEEVIDDLYGVWPFLRDLVLTFRNSQYTYTEFSLINTALVCPSLVSKVSSNLKTLILPRSGVTPFMIAFGAALGVAFDESNSGVEATNFSVGQRVRVDNQAVAIFDGICEFHGEQYIRLKRFTTSQGHKTESASLIRAEQAGRLCPVSEDAALRGYIPTKVDDTDISLAGTEALFHLHLPQQFNNISSRVWLVSQTSSVRMLASEIELFGHSLSGVIPMGHIKRDGELYRWDSRFGESECVLTVISDLDLAAEIFEDMDLKSEDLIVIDLGGSNRNKFAALNYIESLKSRILCIAEEKDSDTIKNLEKNGHEIWEWSPEEIKELYIETNSDCNELHPFQLNDELNVRGLLLSPKIKVVESVLAQKAKSDLDLLVAHARKCGENCPNDLDDVLDDLFEMAFELFRLPVPFNVLSGGVGNRVSVLEQMSDKVKRSLYLDSEEKNLALKVIESLQYLVIGFELENPKTDAIRDIYKKEQKVNVLIPPNFPEEKINLQGVEAIPDILSSWKQVKNSNSKCLLIPYWPGRKKAWEIFSNPPSQEVYFILYSFEDEWRLAFHNYRNRARAKRAQQKHRSTIFRKKHPWELSKKRIPKVEEMNELKKVDSLIDERDFRFHQRVIHSIRKVNEVADTSARMIVFRGGAHAFFTQNHQAWSATNLLSDLSQGIEDDEKLLSVTVKDISEGDVLVFLRGTDRDAIRELADASLPSGTRDIAKLWQVSLRNYVDKHNISASGLKGRLEEAGCKRHVASIRNWLDNESLIGPRYYASGDLEAIAKVTNDQDFRKKMSKCAQAISSVWGEHLRASNTIAKRVLSSFGNRVNMGLDLDSPMDIGDSLVLAQVEYVSHQEVIVPGSLVNQFREYY